MKKLIVWFVLCCLLTTPLISATVYSPALITTADKPVPNEIFLKKITSLNIKDLQKLAGRKFSLKEKISFLILKKSLKHKSGGTQGQGQTAFILGIAALAMLVIGLFVFPVLVGSLVASILAIVFGSVASKKDPSDKKANMGKLFGWITLVLIALLAILVVVVWVSFWSQF